MAKEPFPNPSMTIVTVLLFSVISYQQTPLSQNYFLSVLFLWWLLPTRYKQPFTAFFFKNIFLLCPTYIHFYCLIISLFPGPCWYLFISSYLKHYILSTLARCFSLLFLLKGFIVYCFISFNGFSLMLSIKVYIVLDIFLLFIHIYDLFSPCYNWTFL